MTCFALIKFYLYPSSMKMLDSVGFKNDLGKALIAANSYSFRNNQ